MRWMILLSLVVFSLGCKPSIYLQKSSVQLSKPSISTDAVFFEENATISIGSTAKKAKIEYWDSQNQREKYKAPIKVYEATKINAQALGGGYIASDSVSINVLKMPKNKIVSISSERPLNEKYGKSGLDILINRKNGGDDFNTDWLGYLGDTITFELEFDIIEIDHLIVSSMRNQGAWIFDPSVINVYDGNSKVGSTILESDTEKQNGFVFTRIDVTKVSTRNLTVEVIAPSNIPKWHPGAGNKSWIFIDEILVY